MRARRPLVFLLPGSHARGRSRRAVDAAPKWHRCDPDRPADRVAHVSLVRRAPGARDVYRGARSRGVIHCRAFEGVRREAGRRQRHLPSDREGAGDPEQQQIHGHPRGERPDAHVQGRRGDYAAEQPGRQTDGQRRDRLCGIRIADSRREAGRLRGHQSQRQSARLARLAGAGRHTAGFVQVVELAEPSGDRKRGTGGRRPDAPARRSRPRRPRAG